LNNRTFSEAYCDKNFYHKYLDISLLPKVYLRNIDGVYYSEDYKTINQLTEIEEFIPQGVNKVIVKKAVDSGGGHGVELFTCDGNIWINADGKRLTKMYLEKTHVRNFIVQEYIDQHPFYSQFNESSVNTIRLFTYRSVKNNEIIPLQSVFRIGLPGAIVDNQASGGIACGIQAGGELNSFAVSKKGGKFESFNGILFRDVPKLFKYDEIVKLGLGIANKFHYHRLLGFDFSVDSKGNIKLIEVNNRNNEINFYQMNNGPLFREYTDEVIDYCAQNKKTVCFDFEIK
jgi:hypothetical protein